MGAQIFQKPSRHLKILGGGRVTRSKFHTEGPTNIQHHLTNCSHHDDLVEWDLHTPVLLMKLPVSHKGLTECDSKTNSEQLTLILRRSRRGTVWFYTSTSNKRAARPKLYTKSLTRDLKRMCSRLTLVRISINL